MANRFLNNIKINDSYTLPPADGTANQIIQTNGAGELSFIDPSAISVGESEQVHIACKNTSGVAISKGDPVYITGTVGTSFIIEIAAADASNSAKMPAVGLAETDLGINAEGFVIVSGVLKNLTTDPLSTSDGTPSSNDTVYVKAGGGLTRTKPTGSGNLIQNVGKVGRVNSANAGSLAVSTIMRTNDVPNLTTGKIWVGSSTYTTESTVVHLDETNGRMGIGTTSPGYKLDVNGGAQFNTNTGATPFYITRLGNIDQALSIKVMDDNVRFESIQDESADSYGGFDFRMDGGVTEPNFVIRKNADDPILHVDGAGKVGINSTNPLSTLQVGDGTADSSFRTYYSDSTYAEVRGYGVNFNRQYSYLRPTTDNYAFLYIGSQPNTWNELHLHSNKITFSDNTSEVMRINPGGNVGIGTTSPGQKLTIDQGVGNVNQGIPATSGSTQNGILRLQPGGPYGESFDFGMNVSTTYAWIQPTNKGNHSVNYNLSLNPNGGNVGIGTTNPDSKLEVASSGAEGILISKDTNNTSNSGRLFFETDTISEGFSFLNSNGLMTIRSQAQAGVTSGNARVAIDGSGNVNIGTTSASTVGGTAKMTIDVGASTSSPVSIVNGTTDGMYIRRYSTGGSYQLQTTVGSGNSGNLSLQSYGGNVGIGTTNPATKLHISDATTPEFRIEDTTNNRYLSLYQNDSNSYIQTSLNSPLVFSTHGSNERMRITTSGNIGIGTTSPSYKVSIAGSSSAQLEIINSLNSKSWRPNVNGNDFYITETGVGNPFVIQAGGNVGIGTTTPQAILDIQPSASNRKVTRIANDVTSTYFYNTQADAILAWTCGSYYQAEVVITANQTNGGDYNNLYIRGIWSNNHTSHNWDELERVGFLTGSTITMSVGQNGSTSNSGRLELDFDYISGSFSQLNIRVTDFYGSHSYTIT